MAVDTNIQIVREDPQIEAYRLGLLEDVKDYIGKRIDDPNALPPAYQIAGMSGMENQAAALAQEGIGGFTPFIQGGLEQVLAGQQGIQNIAFPSLQEAQRYYTRAGEMAADPRGATEMYMDPYRQEVINQAMADIQRQGALPLQQARAQAANVGAFGGSRQAVLEGQLARNILEEQARTAANLRSQGYGQAQQMAQQGIGQLANIGAGVAGIGGQAAGIGTQAANLGVQQAGLGELAQTLGLRDITTLSALGGQQRAQQQAELDALRQSNVARMNEPFQLYSYLSDIYRGTPSSQSVTTMSTQQNPSTAQQVLGYGIAGLGALSGAKTAGLSF